MMSLSSNKNYINKVNNNISLLLILASIVNNIPSTYSFLQSGIHVPITPIQLLQSCTNIPSQIKPCHTSYHNNNNNKHTFSTLNMAPKYGKGADIQPPTNERRIRLEDSFPGGVLPPTAATTISNIRIPSSNKNKPKNNNDNNTSNNTVMMTQQEVRQKRSIFKQMISELLQSAAKSEKDLQSIQQEDTSTTTSSSLLEKIILPLFTVALILSGLVSSKDLLFVIFFSGYTTFLGILSNSTSMFLSSPTTITTNGNDSLVGKTNSSTTTTTGNQMGNTRPLMPSLPPQGHVPSIMANPMGLAFSSSPAYHLWLKIGSWIGLLLPFVTLGIYTFLPSLLFGSIGTSSVVEASRLLVAPLFLISCQAWSEYISRHYQAPLPLRILVSVAYNSYRLGCIYDWFISPINLGFFPRLLAIFNFVYWGANLFVLLIPIATMRYLRAHFFCVEASEVTLREGWESDVGLLP